MINRVDIRDMGIQMKIEEATSGKRKQTGADLLIQAHMNSKVKMVYERNLVSEETTRVGHCVTFLRAALITVIF